MRAPDIQVRLGVAIKEYRKRLGVTQEELAWRADMHRSYLADIERGGRNVTLKSIANLACALQVSIEHLLGQSAGGGPGHERPTSLVEILLVEDNPQDVELILRAFKRAKFTNPVKVLDNGSETIDYLNCTGRYAKRQTNPHQLVILDLSLPDMSGLDVLRSLKAGKPTRQIPVVILTASKHDHNIMACTHLGAEHYIIKPMAFDDLSHVAKKIDFHWALVKPPLRV